MPGSCEDVEKGGSSENGHQPHGKRLPHATSAGMKKGVKIWFDELEFLY